MAEMMPGIMDSSSETHREASVMDSVAGNFRSRAVSTSSLPM